MMPVTFDLPQDIEKTLRDKVANPDIVAKEAVLVEMYRQHKLTQHQLAQALGIARLETDGILKAHGVYLEYTVEDLRRELDGYEAARRK